MSQPNQDKKRLGNIRKILVFMQPYYLQLHGLFGLTVLLSILAMAPPLVTRALVDRVFTNGETQLFFGLGFFMVALPILTALFGYIQSLSIAYLGQRFVFDIRCALYKHFLGLSLRFFSKHSVGKLVWRLMGDSGTVQQMLTGQSVGIISDLVCSTFAIIATFAIDWRLAILLIIIVTVFVSTTIQHPPHHRSQQGQPFRLRPAVRRRSELPVANMAVKTFGAEAREHGVFEGQSRTARCTTRSWASQATPSG